ncbi:hypothetical protein Stsp02_08930 [Streptomyces sp. NBRC 14336]|nr:hypothetical protein Stsp02_08930 [Streptomyces sp. NBRC 14336]
MSPFASARVGVGFARPRWRGASPRGGTPSPPVPPQRHDCPQLRELGGADWLGGRPPLGYGCAQLGRFGRADCLGGRRPSGTTARSYEGERWHDCAQFRGRAGEGDCPQLRGSSWQWGCSYCAERQTSTPGFVHIRLMTGHR